ncbi:MAG: hypothetical protein L0241_17200 [Planctomycetia bacterium]|nr:hypothetical protein [Planctomycetia bacterium]
MRDLFGIRLTDPTEDEVASVFRAALAALNGKRKASIFSLPVADVEVLGKRTVSEREGHYELTRPDSSRGEYGRVLLVWWTNPGGRKLVRVRGWREGQHRHGGPGTPEDMYRFADQRALDSRPVVWHLDPERIIAAETGTDPEWVAVCGCGAAGSPESLGWNHGMCGPCADQVAEFGLDAVPREPGLLTEAGFDPWDVMFTPNGRYIISSGYGKCRVWDCASGELRATGDCPRPTNDVRPSVSPDGRFVFLCDGNQRLTFLSLEGDKPRRVEIGPFGPLLTAMWTNWPGKLLVQRQDPARHLSLVDVEDESVKHMIRPPDTSARLFAVHGDDPRLVFTDRHRATVARLDRDGKLDVRARFHIGDGALNRTGNWNSGPELVRFTPNGERLLFIRGTEMELWNPARSKALLQVTFPASIQTRLSLRITNTCSFSPWMV